MRILDSESIDGLQFFGDYFLIQNGQTFRVFQVAANYTSTRIFFAVDNVYEKLPPIKAQTNKFGL